MLNIGIMVAPRNHPDAPEPLSKLYADNLEYAAYVNPARRHDSRLETSATR